MQGSIKPVKYSNEAIIAGNKLPKHLTPEFLKEVAEIIPKDNSPILLMPEEETFLRLYIQGQETRGNGVKCYMMAKGIDPEKWSKEPEKIEVTDIQGKTRTVIKDKSSEFDRKMGSMRVQAHKWLCRPVINARRMQLTNELLKDHIVDNEMAKVIIQDEDRTAKNTAIREYNKLKQRIVDRKDIRTLSAGVIQHLYGEADAFDYNDDD